MSILLASVPFTSGELRSIDLPIEVRRPSLALVKRARTGQEISLPAGSYHVTAELPAGHLLQASVELGKDERREVVLELDPEETPEPEDRELQSYLLRPASGKRNGLPGGGDSSTAVTLFRGNVFGGEWETGDTVKLDWENGVGTTRLPAGGWTIAQLSSASGRPLNVRLPDSGERGCWIIVREGEPDCFSIEAMPTEPVAVSTLRYYTRGMLSEAGTTIRAWRDHRNDLNLLQEPMAEPITVTIGAYVLLRLGELEVLREWTDVLSRCVPIPDGIALRAECLARLGEHDEALEVLLRLPGRGLPMFSDGVAYALKRLLCYAGSEMRVAIERREELTNVLRQVEKFSDCMDYRQQNTTYPGADPRSPSVSLAALIADTGILQEAHREAPEW